MNLTAKQHSAGLHDYYAIILSGAVIFWFSFLCTWPQQYTKMSLRNSLIEKKDNDSKQIEFEKVELQAVDNGVSDALIQQPPDGGYGWVIAFCFFLIQFCTFGYVLLWGVFQEHYMLHLFKNQISYTALSIVGALQVGCILVTGLFLGKPIKLFGIRKLVLFGSLISSSGLILASFSTDVIYPNY